MAYRAFCKLYIRPTFRCTAYSVIFVRLSAISKSHNDVVRIDENYLGDRQLFVFNTFDLVQKPILRVGRCRKCYLIPIVAENLPRHQHSYTYITDNIYRVFQKKN